jgi:ketosteroid isomerase-like protein
MNNRENQEPDFQIWSSVNASLQAYADALDRADFPALLALFTADAVWEYAPGLSRQGHDEIGAFFKERLRAFAQTSHNVGPPVVRWGANSGIYESTAYFTAMHQLRDGTRYSVWGRYVDTLLKTNTGALISRRCVVAHVTEGTKGAYNQLPRQDST